MAEKTLAQKLLIKPGMRGAVINAPAGFRENLGELPEGAQIDTTVDGRYQFLLLFVESQAALTAWSSKVLEASQPGILLWVAYPKKTSGTKADINRDAGWEPLKQAGWDTVAAISIDDMWSALRFRPLKEIQRTGGTPSTDVMDEGIESAE
jgi:hypothetical protein